MFREALVIKELDKVIGYGKKKKRKASLII